MVRGAEFKVIKRLTVSVNIQVLVLSVYMRLIQPELTY